MFRLAEHFASQAKEAGKGTELSVPDTTCCQSVPLRGRFYKWNNLN